MESVSVREDKAFLVTGISIFGGCLCLLWFLFLLLLGAEKPWWIWLLVSMISDLNIGLIAIFAVILAGNKTIVSATSIVKSAFGRKRKILRGISS